MNGCIKRSAWLAMHLFCWLVMALPAQAASFDCGKAQSTVEKMVCTDTELSRLDEEIAKVYGEVLKIFPDEALLKKQQRGWLKARNQCKEITCVRDYYRGRLAELNEANVFKAEESYTLVMSKDDELCNHMMELFNQDLKQYGWRGDEHQEEHEEFKRVPWQPARFSSVIDGRTEYTDVEGALFDFNNDGVQDFVVRWKSSLSNARADLLLMLDREMAKRANELVSSEFWNAGNQIDLAGWFYDVSLPVKVMVGLRVLQPFIYHETSYLFMRESFETPPIKPGYAVVVKYGGGKFINREMTGKMEDICYYKRNRAKRTH
ncbi:MAG: lysozyme inhibitor LprI family protein [Sulfuricella sp.]|nr:lysozyme inhibitor LprI family protein [Sulfuricella sp.]